MRNLIFKRDLRLNVAIQEFQKVIQSILSNQESFFPWERVQNGKYIENVQYQVNETFSYKLSNKQRNKQK